MYTSETVNLLRKVFEWSVVDPRDIDDEKYLLGKRFSEVKCYYRGTVTLC